MQLAVCRNGNRIYKQIYNNKTAPSTAIIYLVFKRLAAMLPLRHALIVLVSECTLQAANEQTSAPSPNFSAQSAAAGSINRIELRYINMYFIYIYDTSIKSVFTFF